MKYILVIVLATIIIGCSSTKKIINTKSNTITVAFYNLENLFDTINSEHIRDGEFTPESKKEWNTTKYQSKIQLLSQVISKLGTEKSPDGPAIVGISETENKMVLEDLINSEALGNKNYGIVHYDSPDRRGIDVALLYQNDIVKVIHSDAIPLLIDSLPDYASRDQLVVECEIEGETLYFIVNHWPSRYGGEEKSRPFRRAAAELSRAITDSIFQINSKAKIILMGDLNDDPNNESIKTYLGTVGDPIQTSPREFYNPMDSIFAQGNGTLMYRDKWNLFDQILVTRSLAKKNPKGFHLEEPIIYDPKYLFQNEGRYAAYPFRTYAGDKYLGGYSDHLPVYILLHK